MKLDCRTCLGGGEILIGWDTQRATMMSPPEPVFDECPVCWGTGFLHDFELDETFEGEWPTEEDAREMREAAMAMKDWDAVNDERRDDNE